MIGLDKNIDTFLDQVFLDHYEYCIRYLCKQFASGNYYCGEDDAKDVFMDALLRLRRAFLKGGMDDKNIRGYLITICKNIWLKKKEKEKVVLPLDIEKAEYYLGKKEGLYHTNFNPLVKSEQAQKLKDHQQMQIDAFTDAWAALGEKCKQLLKAFYIDRLKLKDLQERTIRIWFVR